MIYKPEDIPLDLILSLPEAPKPKGNPGRKERPRYKAVCCAFDIETTSLKKYRQAVMYIWQLQIGFEITIVGRTWDEFLDVTNKLLITLGDVKLVTYVHNLSYEFQFLSGIWTFAPEDVFCTEPRNILHANMGPYEFRCSYRLANMSLDQFTKQMRVSHRKLSGEKFDYDKIRYPWTKLTKYEMDYATYDVIGLVEAVTQLMINESDTLYSIPMTSTGYVRRDVKKAMKTFNWETMRRMIPEFEIHEKLVRGFRGGNTHTNRHFVGQIVYNTHSADVASSYPAQMLLHDMPMGRWYTVKPENLTIDFLKDLIYRRHKAVLIEVAFLNIRLRDPRWPVPYLPFDKCDHVIPYTTEDLNGTKLRISVDNGRIMAAQYLETILTDIDLKIIADEYDWDKLEIKFCAFSTYGKLPAQLREVVLDYYVKKTSLKGVHGKQFLYDASKRKINAIYGCTVQNPIQIRYLFTETGEVPYIADESKSRRELYETATKWAFQCYAWGCWITAAAREKLEEGIKLVYEQGEKEKRETGKIRTHFIYCDTDSIKYTGNVDLNILNDRYIREAEKAGAYADDPKGKRHYIGVFENETVDDQGRPAPYPEFLSWGAKKYCYRTVDGSEILAGMHPDATGRIYPGKNCRMYCTVAGTGDTWNITIAGVNKAIGGRELEKAGGIKALLPDEYGRPYFVFREAGGIEAVYNDQPEIRRIKVQGHELEITRNLYLEKHPYTLSVTEEFKRIIMHPDLWRDLIDSGTEI